MKRLLLFAISFASASADAATFVVTTAADADNGACTSKRCTLRDALTAANNSADADTVRFAGEYIIAPSHPLPAIVAPVTIAGDVTIDGAGALPLFVISGGAAGQVSFRGLTLRRAAGYAIFAASSTLDVSLRDCRVSETNGNAVRSVATTTTISGSSFEDNFASGNGAAILLVDRGGTQSASVSDCEFFGNTAASGEGGAVASDIERLTVTGCYFADNSAVRGGGVSATGPASGIERSAFFGNAAAECGGATISGARAYVVNSTFGANFTENHGAALCATGAAGERVVQHNTFADNQGGALYADAGASIAYAANVFARNTTPACAVPGGSRGYNVTDDESCVRHAQDAYADPGLATVATQNGPKLAHRSYRLSGDSAAIDFSSTPASLDQRGRPVCGVARDAGAYELGGYGVVELAAGTPEVSEGSTLSLTATKRCGDETTISANWTLFHGTTAPADFSFSAAPFTLSAPAFSAAIALTVVDDAWAEGDELFVVQAADASGYADVGSWSALHILASDRPTLTFASPASTIGEGGSVDVTLTLSLPLPQQAVIVGISSTHSAQPSELSPLPTTVTFAPGQTTQRITIRSLDDTLHEPNADQVTLRIHYASVAAIGSLSTHTVTILDSDPPPTITWQLASDTVSEGAAEHHAMAILSHPSEAPVLATIALSGSASSADYSIPTTLMIPPLATSGAITWSALLDGLFEEDEHVVMGLTSITGAGLGSPASYDATIVNADPMPTLTVTRLTTVVAEVDGPTPFAQLRLDVLSAVMVTIAVTTAGSAVAGEDYAPIGYITIPPGSLGFTLTFDALPDGLAEGIETASFSFVVTNANAVLPAPTLDIDIVD